MYKRPSKRSERIRLSLIYSFMTFVVVVTVAIFVLLVANYRYNSETGLIEQRGLIQLASTPSGATVTIDGQQLSSHTPTKSTVYTGRHEVDVTKQYYEPWHRSIDVKHGELLWLDYIRFVPKKITYQDIVAYPDLGDSTVSPDKKTILVKTGDTVEPTFQRIDISRDNITATTFKLPLSLTKDFSVKKEQNVKVSYRFGKWDRQSDHVIVWRKTEKEKQPIVLDVKNPTSSVNVARKFAFSVDSVQFSKDNVNTAFVLSDGKIRRYVIGADIIGASIASNVESFTVQASDKLTYISQESLSSSVKQLMYLSSAKSTPVALKEIDNNDKDVSLLTVDYLGNSYIIIANDKRLNIYKGDYRKGVSQTDLLASKEFSEPITSIEVNKKGNHILARMKTGFISYSLARYNFSSIVQLDEVQASELFWFDGMHVGLVDKDGNLTIRDLDGSNVYQLGQAQRGQAASLSQRGTYVYFFSRSDEGSQLKRLRMILP